MSKKTIIEIISLIAILTFLWFINSLIQKVKNSENENSESDIPKGSLAGQPVINIGEKTIEYHP